MNRVQGIFYGLLAAASFGLIPLFTVPLVEDGIRVDSVLFYRFLFATAIVGCVMLVRRESFRMAAADLGRLFLMGIFYSGSAIFYFLSFGYMATGMATTIHFLYPAFVALLMMFFFHERRSPITFMAIALALGGVALLSSGNTDSRFNLLGLAIVLISALANASYITGMSRIRLAPCSALKLTFFLLAFGSLCTLTFALFHGPLEPIASGNMLGRLLLLAAITGALSNLSLIASITRIGSTLAAILGATEPLTAVLVGILVFHEPMTLIMGSGIVLILAAVFMIILTRNIEELLRRRKKRPAQQAGLNS